MERSMEARPFEQTIGKSRRPVLDILVFGSGFGEGASKDSCNSHRGACLKRKRAKAPSRIPVSHETPTDIPGSGTTRKKTHACSKTGFCNGRGSPLTPTIIRRESPRRSNSALADSKTLSVPCLTTEHHHAIATHYRMQFGPEVPLQTVLFSIKPGE